MKNEIRKVICGWLFEYILWILPKGEFKLEFVKFIVKNIEKL